MESLTSCRFRWQAALAGDAAGLEAAASAMDTSGFRSAVLADPPGAVFSIAQLTAGP